MEFNPFSISSVKEILKKNGIFLSKSRGQNFLIDRNISQNIIKNIPENSIVFEVGPGLGALTIFILKKARKVYAIEIDRKIFEVLKGLFEEYDNLYLFNEDFLRFNIMEKIKEKEVFFVSNLPYSISGEAIKKFIEEKCFKSGIVMLQKEFVDRMLAKPQSENYGVLSLLSFFYLETEKLFNVSKTCFFPIPEVDSIVVKLSKKKCNYPQNAFSDFLKKAFSKRRKTIGNNLKNLGFTEEEILKCGVKSDFRPEEIEFERWATLFEYYQSHKYREP